MLSACLVQLEVIYKTDRLPQSFVLLGPPTLHMTSSCVMSYCTFVSLNGQDASFAHCKCMDQRLLCLDLDCSTIPSKFILPFILTLAVLQGFVSNADYSGKKTVLVLFINGRPVECSPLKRALEATYAAILPKASKPWVFLVRPSPDLPPFASPDGFKPYPAKSLYLVCSSAAIL